MSSLIIIAGPNGAGKSTVSADLLSTHGIQAFDFDKRFYHEWGKYGSDPYVESGVREKIITDFETHLSVGFRSRSYVSFETNFNNPRTLDHVKNAKKHGLKTELIFIGLKSDDLAVSRVQQRINNGGHAVDELTIRSRYHHGLDLLDKNHGMFDEVRIYESPQGFAPVIKCIGINKKKVTLLQKPSFITKIPLIKSFIEKWMDQGMSM